MIKRLLFLLVFFHLSVAYSQTIKTDVLVIGGSSAGIAAAMQCARSKVKTILIEQGPRLYPLVTDKFKRNSLPDANWPGGIWAELMEHVIQHYNYKPGYDTTFSEPLLFDPDTAAAILTHMADTLKGLTVQLNTSFVNIVKDDDRWNVSLLYNGHKQTIKARVIIDATSNSAIMTAAGGTYNVESDWRLNYNNNLYRTSVAMGKWVPFLGEKYGKLMSNTDWHLSEYFIPVKAFLAKGVTNLLVTGALWMADDESTASLDLRPDMVLGQGAGVIAAYSAFFKTTTANLNVRKIQNELLDFKGDLLPVNDVGADPYWRDIQQVCATGLLKVAMKQGQDETKVSFDGDSTVNTAEIKLVMLEIYTRSFLWFNKQKPGKYFTIGDLLSFISEITLNDPDNLQKTIAHDWSTKYNFKSDFDMDRPITRREFAILVNKYLNPFARTVDLDGKVIN